MSVTKMKLVERDKNNPLVPGHTYLFNWIKPYIRNAQILDIGCWTGEMEILLEKENCRVIGIDKIDEPLIVARKRFPQYEFIKFDTTKKLPFPNKHFDLVMFFMVIEHLPKGSEQKALENINKVMKKGGMLFFNTMNWNLLSIILDPAFIFGHRHYSRNFIYQILDKAGFKVLETRYNGGFYTALHIFLLYFYKHILHKSEPRNGFLDMLMARDYRNKGFAEIDIRAIKVKDL